MLSVMKKVLVTKLMHIFSVSIWLNEVSYFKVVETIDKVEEHDIMSMGKYLIE